MTTCLSSILAELGSELQDILRNAQTDITSAQERLGAIPQPLMQNGSLATCQKASKLLEDAFNEILQLRILLHRPFPTQEPVSNVKDAE
jgi:hypothetical protein